MSCAEFERWLDEGMPEEGAGVAHAHAESCATCAASLHAAEAIDAGLSRVRFVAPARVTGRVMARVAAVEARRAATAVAPRWSDAFPWWVRAAAEPASITATLLCGVLFWKWDAIAAAGVAAFQWLATAGAASLSAGPLRALAQGGLGVQLALLMVVLPAAAWLAVAAFRISDRWIERAAFAPHPGRLLP